MPANMVARSPNPRSRHPPFPSNKILTSQQRQWIFTANELSTRTPSTLDGMDPALELSNRAKGVSFITQCCILLGLPQLTLHTASVFLHRFFIRYSMVDRPEKPGHHHYAVAATCLFLASKVEENCRKMKELIVACCRVAQKDPNLVVDEQSKEYWRWRDTILLNEDLLLEAMCFDLSIEHPYRFLFNFLCYFRIENEKVLRNEAWAFLNDSNSTTLCLMYPPRTIAAASLFFALTRTHVKVQDDEEGRAWWEILGVSKEDISDISNTMAERYEDSQLARKGGKYDRVPEDNSTIHQTRGERTPGTPTSGSGSEKRKREDDPSPDQKDVQNGAPKGSSSPSEKEEPNAKRLKLESPVEHTMPIHHSRPATANSSQSIQSQSIPPPPPAPSPPEPASQSTNSTSIAENPDAIQARIDSITAAASSNLPPSQHDRRTSSLSSTSISRPPLDRHGSSWEKDRYRGSQGRENGWNMERRRSGDGRPREGDRDRPRDWNRRDSGSRDGDRSQDWNRRGSGSRDGDRDLNYDSQRRRSSSGQQSNGGRPEYVGPVHGRERGYSGSTEWNGRDRERDEDRDRELSHGDRDRNQDRHRPRAPSDVSKHRGASEEGEV